MSDQNPPAEDQQAAGQNPPAAPDPAAQATWEARYKGMTRDFEAQRKQIADLTAQAADFALKLEQAKVALQQREAELNSAKTGAAQAAQESQTALQKLAQDLEAAKAYRAKMEALRKHPQLLPLAEMLPETQDAAALESQCQKLAQVVSQTVEQEVARKTAGFTPGPPPTKIEGDLYTTEQQWSDALMEVAQHGTPQQFAELDMKRDKWLAARPK